MTPGPSIGIGGGWIAEEMEDTALYEISTLGMREQIEAMRRSGPSRTNITARLSTFRR
jgi:hypothetical protein